MFFGLFEGPLKAPAFGSCTMAVCRMRPEIVKTIPAVAATLNSAGRGTRVTRAPETETLGLPEPRDRSKNGLGRYWPCQISMC
jgi:hypothetical protein